MKEINTSILKELTLLCVEDDFLIAKGLIETLSHFVKKVLWANSGQEGLKVFLEYPIDIVFTDIIMENGDGLSFIEAIRATHQNIPIVAISSYKEFDGMQRLIDKNLVAFISKPFTFEAVYEALLKCAKNCEPFIALSEELRFYSHQMILTCKDKCIHITSLEQRFILFALQSNKTIMTKQAIEETVWGNEVMSDDALKTLIKRIRAKMGMPFVKAIPDVGYVLHLEEI